MKQKSVIALTFILALAAGAFLLLALGPQAQAQQPCLELRAIWHATLPSPIPYLPTDTWGGPVYASLDGEFLLGNLSGNDGDSSGHGKIGQARGGAYKICFSENCADSFIYEVSNAVFPFPPGKVGVGYYRGNTAKIVQGTGRFEFALGNLNVAAPFIVYQDSGGNWNGRGSGEITGKICGVAR